MQNARKLVIILGISLCILRCSHSPTQGASVESKKNNSALTIPVSETHKTSLKAELRGDHSYLSLDLYYPPFKKLKEQVEETLKTSLKSRGEAHITLISPMEYKLIMAELSIEKIYEILSNDFKNPTAVDFECFAEGQMNKDGKKMSTYFVVVKSKEILAARAKIKSLLKTSTSFDPLNYYPHVTVGFSDRDLHFEDGVIKNSQACSAKLNQLLTGFKL